MALSILSAARRAGFALGVLLAASALAAYMGIEKFYWRTLGRHLLPLGPAWIRPAGPIDPES